MPPCPRVRNANLFSVCLFLTCIARARAELIVNGSFESPTVPSAGTIYFAPSIDITGWFLRGGSVDLVGTRWQATSGLQSIDLAGVANATIDQSFATVAGNSYRLSFDYANNPEGAFFGLPSSTGMVRLLNGSQILFSSEITHSGSAAANMNYTSFSTIFTATGPTTTLEFKETDPRTDQRFGLVLDAVSVQVVPEASSLAMLIATTSSLLLRRN